VTSSIREWLNLLVRWFHVSRHHVVGQTYYFTGLMDNLAGSQKLRSGWYTSCYGCPQWGLLHGRPTEIPKVGPSRFTGLLEALMTWLSGIVLLFLVLFQSGLSIRCCRISKAAASPSDCCARWRLVRYDLARDPRWQIRSAVCRVLFGWRLSVLLGLMHVYGRAAYIHVARCWERS